MFVIDCSITMPWLFVDEQTEFTESILDRLLKEEAVVPSIWIFEVTNVLLVGERRNRITPAQSARFIETLKSFPIKIEEETSWDHSESLLITARTHSLSAYDTAYLNLAMRLGIPLATLDRKLKDVAKKLGVQIL